MPIELQKREFKVMIPVLLDPFLLTFKTQEDYENNVKANSIKECLKLIEDDNYPLRLSPFINEEERQSFNRNITSYGFIANRSVMQRIVNNLTFNGEENIGAAIIDAPSLRLTTSWLKALARSGNEDDAPYWRHPMIVTNTTRKAYWPADNDGETNYTFNGQKSRNLIPFENLSEHIYFERDIDPWRLKCVGAPKTEAPVSERSSFCMRLPRPPQLNYSLPISQLLEQLGRLRDWSCESDTHFFYLPHKIWDPINFSKEEWRDGSFPRGNVLKKGRKQIESGYRDRNDYIWVWDKQENDHWDVKTTENIRIARISFTGRRKRMS